MDFVIRIAIGVALYFLIRPKPESQSSATTTGRIWLAWSTLLMSFVYYPHQMGLVNEIATRLFGLVVIGAIAFTIGSVLGRNKSIRAQTASVAASVAPARFSDAHPSTTITETNLSKSKPVSHESDSTISPQPAIDVDNIYTEIANELEIGVADKGLWIRLFAESGGDERQTKVLYIKQRAERLIEAEKANIELEARKRTTETERKESLHLEELSEDQRHAQLEKSEQDREAKYAESMANQRQIALFILIVVGLLVMMSLMGLFQ